MPSPSELHHPVSFDRAEWADPFAGVVLENLSREYPYHAGHLIRADDDLRVPRVEHPSFGTSFDWHSCVHMHWLGVQLLGFGVSAAHADALSVALGTTLVREKLDVEADYLRANPHYERPYGWAWAFALIDAVHHSEVPAIRALAPAFDGLAEVLRELAVSWLGGVPEPVRHGVHSNSAFGIRLILRAARTLGYDEVVAACEGAARRWFGADRDWPFAYERSGQDFLSPGLVEADLMHEVLDPGEYAQWAIGFFGALSADATVLAPVVVLDPSDPQQTHLYGLDLVRAAAATRVSAALDVSTEPRAAELARLLAQAVPRLLPAGLEAAVSDEYYSSHWIATFAWDALCALA